jgi:uncharacterized protein (DUF2147 family)
MKTCTVAFAALLMMSIVIAVVPMASAAGAITLTPTSQAPTASVTVDGTAFGAEKAVGIGFGAEVTVELEAHPITNLVSDPVFDEGLGVDTYGPFGGTADHIPIKPGSVYVFYDVDGTTSEYFDKDPPDGTLQTDSAYAIDPRVNYVNGSFGRRSSADWSAFSAPVAYITYTYYTYNVTPAAGVTTTGAGAFSGSITVPDVANGQYTVTAVDTAGNIATSTLTVDNTIPEGLTLGVMLLLSTIAVIVSVRYFRKQPKTKSYNSVKV